jgi:hypothetical protein
LGAVAIASDDAGTASRTGADTGVRVDEPTGTMAADTARIVVLGPVAGEPCGLRIRGNVPC